MAAVDHTGTGEEVHGGRVRVIGVLTRFEWVD